jgi:hypothetical protein
MVISGESRRQWMALTTTDMWFWHTAHGFGAKGIDADFLAQERERSFQAWLKL